MEAGKSTPLEKNNDHHSKKQKNRDRRPSLDKTTKKVKAPDLRILRPPPSKYTNYAYLTASHEDVLLVVEPSGVFKWPDPLLRDRSKRNQNKYYRFHKDIGHTTEECITMKDEIEKLICHGYLQDYINDKKVRPQND